MRGPRFPLRWLAAAFLLAQLAAVVHQRFVPERFFGWAPHDRQTLYRLEVAVDGRRLSDREILLRYRIPARGRDSHSQHNLFRIIERHERTYGAGDRTVARLHYRVNGRPEREWTWRDP